MNDLGAIVGLGALMAKSQSGNADSRVEGPDGVSEQQPSN